jgi:hypothetical protein
VDDRWSALHIWLQRMCCDGRSLDAVSLPAKNGYRGLILSPAPVIPYSGTVVNAKQPAFLKASSPYLPIRKDASQYLR